MGRSRGGSGGRSSAPRRPSVPATRPAVTSSQAPSRSVGSLAAPRSTGMQQYGNKVGPPAPTGQQKSPGLFGQMASTAAGVAVGSSIGHAIGGFFGGGSAAPAEQEQQQQNMDSYNGEQAAANNQNTWGAPSCELDARAFTRCLDENQGNMQTCGWYLEQLKACQQAASQY